MAKRQVVLMAEIEVEPGDGAEQRAQEKLDAFREAVRPSSEYGITLYQPPALEQFSVWWKLPENQQFADAWNAGRASAGDEFATIFNRWRETRDKLKKTLARLDEANRHRGRAQQVIGKLMTRLAAGDDPKCDDTPFSHPAYERGKENAYKTLTWLIHRLLDGTQPDIGTANEPWGSLRSRLIELRDKARGNP
jgi:hypothetical protein